MNLLSTGSDVMISPEDQQRLSAALPEFDESNPSFLSSSGTPLPDEINAIIAGVLKAVRNGQPVTVSTLPREVTTTTAASMLGISRPTLMKMIRNGRLSSRKVGTHHKLDAFEVLRVRDAIEEEKVQAVFEVMDIEHELEHSHRTRGSATEPAN